MAQIRRGGQIQSKLAFLIYGDKGTWKSSLALEFAKMKKCDFSDEYRIYKAEIMFKFISKNLSQV